MTTGTPEPTFALLVLPESTPASIYGLYGVFRSVGRDWELLTGEKPTGRRIRPRIVARDGVPPASRYGVPITPQEGLGDADVVIVSDLAFHLIGTRGGNGRSRPRGCASAMPPAR